MKAYEFVNKLKDITEKYKTLYVMGCFGAPMTDSNKKRYTQNHSYNKKSNRKNMILNSDSDTFGFDCVCLIKGILWGWNGDKSKSYGGAIYRSNQVPDYSADQFIRLCETSKDWSKIVPGCAVWMPGHIGVYVGAGKVVECTPKWDNCVQYSYLKNIGYNQGHCRSWTLWGYIPYIDYAYLKEEVEEGDAFMYNSISECPDWSKEAVKYFVEKGYLKGVGDGSLNLDDTLIRVIVLMYRVIKGGE